MIANNTAIVNIENFNYKNYNSKINSPRSLEACNRLGIDTKDLYFIDFNQYKLTNPEIFVLDKEIQKIRWNHMNQLKEKYINNIINERRRIIYSQNMDHEYNDFRKYSDDESDQKSNNNFLPSPVQFRSISNIGHTRSKSVIPMNKTFNRTGFLSSSNAFKATAIEKELKILEKAKERQKIQIQALIQHNLNKQHHFREIEVKSSPTRVKNGEIKTGMINSIQKRKTSENNCLDFELNNIQNTNNNSIPKTLSNFNFKLKKGKENKLTGSNFFDDENEFASEDNIINFQTSQIHRPKRNFSETKRKIEEYKHQCEKQWMEERIKAEEKKRRFEEKEKERLENVERKRQEKIRENEQIRVLHKKRYQDEKQKLEERLKIEADMMRNRQLRSDMKRQQLDDLRQMAFKKKAEETLKKMEEIQKFFVKEKQKEEYKSSQLDKKLMDIENHKKYVDKLKEEEIKQKINELKIKEQKSSQVRGLKEKRDNEKRESVVEKINEVSFKVKIQKEVKERDLMFKNEKNSLRRSETIMNVRRIENVKEFENHKRREKIEEQYYKTNTFKEQKSFIMTQKRFLSIDTSNKRQIILNQFEDITKEPAIEETVKELFPDDPKFIEKIQTFKENLINKSSQFSAFKNNFASEKRISLNKVSTIEKEQRMLNQVERLRKNFSLVDTKPIYKSMTLNINSNKQKDISQKTRFESENENRIKFIEKNPISEQTLENDLKQTNENINTQKINFIKDIKQANSSNEIFNYDAKITKNNLQKFNMTKTKLDSTSNLNPYMAFGHKTDKIKNYFNITNPKYQSQMNLTNPKIKIKISNDVSEKIKNSNEYLTNKKGNILYNSFSHKFDKNASININDKIMDFSKIADLTSGFDDRAKTKKIISEEDIKRKLAIYRIKLNSEMLRLLNEEKNKENDRQTQYENIKDNEEKNNFEQEVSKERLESSDKIVRINNEIERKIRDYENYLRTKL